MIVSIIVLSNYEKWQPPVNDAKKERNKQDANFQFCMMRKFCHLRGLSLHVKPTQDQSIKFKQENIFWVVASITQFYGTNVSVQKPIVFFRESNSCYLFISSTRRISRLTHTTIICCVCVVDKCRVVHFISIW